MAATTQVDRICWALEIVGESLVYSSLIQGNGYVNSVALPTLENPKKAQSSDSIRSIVCQFEPISNERFFAIGKTAERIFCWEIQDGQPVELVNEQIEGIEKKISKIAYAQETRFLYCLSSDQSQVFFKVYREDGEKSDQCNDWKKVVYIDNTYTDAIQDIAASGSLLAVSYDSSCSLYSVEESGRCCEVQKVAFQAWNGIKRLVFCSSSCLVGLLSSNQWFRYVLGNEAQITYFPTELEELGFNPQLAVCSKRVAIGGKGEIGIFNLDSGQMITSINLRSKRKINALAVTPTTVIYTVLRSLECQTYTDDTGNEPAAEAKMECAASPFNR